MQEKNPKYNLWNPYQTQKIGSTQFFNPIIESINHPMLLVTFLINYWFLLRQREKVLKG